MARGPGVEGDAVSTPWWRPTVLALVGAALGVIGARYVLVGSGLEPAAVGPAALLVGVLAGSRRLAALDGAVFGFALAFVFMVGRVRRCGVARVAAAVLRAARAGGRGVRGRCWPWWAGSSRPGVIARGDPALRAADAEG